MSSLNLQFKVDTKRLIFEKLFHGNFLFLLPVFANNLLKEIYRRNLFPYFVVVPFCNTLPTTLQRRQPQSKLCLNQKIHFQKCNTKELIAASQNFFHGIPSLILKYKRKKFESLTPFYWAFGIYGIYPF